MAVLVMWNKSQRVGTSIPTLESSKVNQCSGQKNHCHKYVKKKEQPKTLLHLKPHSSNPCFVQFHPQPPIMSSPPLRPLPWQDWQPLRVFLFRRGSPSRKLQHQQCSMVVFNRKTIWRVVFIYVHIPFYGFSKIQNAALCGSSVTQTSIHHGYPWKQKRHQHINSLNQVD